MKRSIVLLTVTAVVVTGLLLILSIVTAGAAPVQLGVHLRYDYAKVRSDPELPVLITVADSSGSVKATVSGQTNEGGTFGSWMSEWQPEHPDIMPGDKVTAVVDGTTGEIDPVGNITGLVDFDTDMITGTVEAAWFAPTTLAVRCITYSDTEEGPVIDLTGIEADGGTFVCDWDSLGYDIQRGWNFAILYYEPDGDQIQNVPISPWMRVNYDHDWVGGDYPAGHVFDITVKDNVGNVKATAVVESDPYGGWGGSGGFDTDWEDWTPNGPDIVPGDVVHFVSDDGYDNEVKAGQINGEIDLVMNGVSGDILVPWFSGEMPIECHPWGAPGEWPGVEESSAMADGSSEYECYWDTKDWELKKGQEVAVMYVEADDDRVIAVLQDPVPNMTVNKWVAGGSEEVAEDGTAVFMIGYRNEGEAAAPTVYLTDTLPIGASYVSDSSGVTPTIITSTQTVDTVNEPAAVSGKPTMTTLIWEFEAVEADNRDHEFYLILNHKGGDGDTLTNVVDIYADYDQDEDNNHAQAEVQVIEGQPDLFIDKWRASEDPVPGGTFLYEIHYGNQGPVLSGAVKITDTLPENTEVVDWYSRDGYDVWQGNVTNGKLILEAPAIPAYWDDSIMLRLRVAPGTELDTQLFNEVMIETDNDSDPDNNEAAYDDTYVTEPNWNLSGSKDNRMGSLVPGGYVNYRIEIANDGNMPVEAKLVDTMPAGTTFLETEDFDPVIENGTLVWDMGLMLPGERVDIHFRLAIDKSVQPGTVLKNCVEAVMVDHEDYNPGDDAACVEDMVHEAGPNLRVVKRSDWEGEGPEYIRYEIFVGNTGTTTLTDVVVTDTYPEGTTFNDEWDSWWGDVEIKHDPGQREIEWTMPDMNPGDMVAINFRVELDGDLIGEQGLTFVNLVEAPMSGDVYPPDNSYEHKTYSGPDVYVQKWASDGIPKPGQMVTFTVEFGNANPSYWQTDDAVLEDTLADGLTFIKATNPWDPEEISPPDRITGNVLAWDLGHIGPGRWGQMEIVVKIDDDVQLGGILTNEVEIFTVPEEEKDPVLGNNKDSADIRVWQPMIYLPVIMLP